MPTYLKNLQEVDIVKCEYSRASVLPAPVPKKFISAIFEVDVKYKYNNNYYITPTHLCNHYR